MNKMTGLSEEDILSLSDKDKAYKGKSEWRYWTAEVYSFGKHIREYAFYPSFLPLYIYTDHGPGYYNLNPEKHELESDAYCQFYHSFNRVEYWKKRFSKPCYPLFSPFVFCRRKNKIQKSQNAKGTIAFPAHNTTGVSTSFNIEDYILQLKALPEEFQPVSICLHMHDINEGLHKVFMKYDIPVYTAGHALDFRFAERFYNILKNFKYSTSNILGSYTYYSVEMEVPFFLYGNTPDFYNSSNSNLEKGEYKFYEEENYLKIHKMFESIHTTITEEQKNHVEKGLGIKEGLGRFKMAQVLYTAYFKKGGLKNSILAFLNYIKRYPLFFLRKDFWQAWICKDNF